MTLYTEYYTCKLAIQSKAQLYFKHPIKKQLNNKNKGDLILPTYRVDQSFICREFPNFMEACSVDVGGPTTQIEAVGFHVTRWEGGNLYVVVYLLQWHQSYKKSDIHVYIADE